MHDSFRIVRKTAEQAVGEGDVNFPSSQPTEQNAAQDQRDKKRVKKGRSGEKQFFRAKPGKARASHGRRGKKELSKSKRRDITEDETLSEAAQKSKAKIMAGLGELEAVKTREQAWTLKEDWTAISIEGFQGKYHVGSRTLSDTHPTLKERMKAETARVRRIIENSGKGEPGTGAQACSKAASGEIDALKKRRDFLQAFCDAQAVQNLKLLHEIEKLRSNRPV